MRKGVLKFGFTLVTMLGILGVLGSANAGASLAAAPAQAHAVARTVTVTVSPNYECYFPIISPFYCDAQTQNGNAPLFTSSGNLDTTLPLNDKVKLTCWYYGNPPSPWKGDGYQDHVTWENISHPITGHIPDHYVNLGDQTPPQIGVPQC